MAAIPSLPEDIMGAEILTRLTVKSILRFRCVCKLWKSMFSGSDFIKSHIHLTSQNPNNDCLLVNKIAHGKYNLYTGESDSYHQISILDNYNLSETRISKYSIESSIKLIGSVNGLVCLLDLSPKQKQIILCNPAIRQCKKFYFPRLPQLLIDICGFCWDPVRNDYKVVMCGHHTNIEGTSDIFSLVYSCNSNSWRPLPNFSFPSPYVDSGTPAAIVKGVPFWRFTKYCGEKFISSILKFDAGCDEFSLLPELDYDIPTKNQFVLVSLKDCLTTLVYNIYNLVDVYCFDEGDGFWRKMYNVGPINSHMHHSFNHGVEFVFGEYGNFFCYDRKTNKIKKFGNQRGLYLLNYYSYKASLVCIDGMEPIHLATTPLLDGTHPYLMEVTMVALGG